MDTIQPFLDYFAANPEWALLIVFLIAFGEALLIIGLFVPSTVALLGAGALVGMGKLGFWEVLGATAIGAILGDQVSFWAGRLYGERLKQLWPLKNYPLLVERGENFVRSHGGKSIAIGRFVPGVKAVVPGIVGMLGMGQAFFAAVNFSSGIVWALAHLVPGILLGQGLALAGELSGHLAIVLIVLIAVVGGAAWLIRIAVGWVWPVVLHAQGKFYVWTLASRSKALRRFGRALAPHNPRSSSVVIFALLALTTLLAGLRLVGGISVSGTTERIDVSVFRMLQSLRDATGDELMVMITMFGDTWPLLMFCGAMALWLFWKRAYRAAIALVVTALAAKAFVPLLKSVVERPRPIDLLDGAEAFSFPSGHATMAMVAAGLFAIIAARGLGRWTRALIYGGAGAAAVLIAFSRIYLGAHWFSDVAGGLLFGALFTAAFGIFIETFPPRRTGQLGFAIVSLAALAGVGVVHIAQSYEAEAAIYVRRTPLVHIAFESWPAGEWASLPAKRIDLAGGDGEAFIAQWAGPVEKLTGELRAKGWSSTPRWSWSASLGYLNPSSELRDLLPRPALHQGLKADMTMVRLIDGDSRHRLVLRIWTTDYRLTGLASETPVQLISLTRDELSARFGLYALPRVKPAAPEEMNALAGDLRSIARVLPAQGGEALLLLGN